MGTVVLALSLFERIRVSDGLSNNDDCSITHRDSTVRVCICCDVELTFKLIAHNEEVANVNRLF